MLLARNIYSIRVLFGLIATRPCCSGRVVVQIIEPIPSQYRKKQVLLIVPYISCGTLQRDRIQRDPRSRQTVTAHPYTARWKPYVETTNAITSTTRTFATGAKHKCVSDRTGPHAASLSFDSVINPPHKRQRRPEPNCAKHDEQPVASYCHVPKEE